LIPPRAFHSAASARFRRWHQISPEALKLGWDYHGPDFQTAQLSNDAVTIDAPPRQMA
jgi:hypothetical protein